MVSNVYSSFHPEMCLLFCITLWKMIRFSFSKKKKNHVVSKSNMYLRAWTDLCWVTLGVRLTTKYLIHLERGLSFTMACYENECFSIILKACCLKELRSKYSNALKCSNASFYSTLFWNFITRGHCNACQKSLVLWNNVLKNDICKHVLCIYKFLWLNLDQKHEELDGQSLAALTFIFR